MAGHGVRAASEAVDLGAGLQFARFPRSRRGAKTRTGGDLIPEETDPWDPAPRALAPEEPESRDARRTVVRRPPRRRCPRGTSGAYRPRHAIHYGSDPTPVERASSASPT